MDSSQPQLCQPVSAPFDFTTPEHNYRRDTPPSQPMPVVAMNSEEMTTKAEPVDNMAAWSTPTSQSIRPRPATIHEGFSYCLGEGFEGLPAWDSSTLALQQTPSDTMSSSRPISMHEQFYPPSTLGQDNWAHKTCEEGLEYGSIDGELAIGQAYTADESIPILDLRYSDAHVEGEGLHFDSSSLHPRRMSGSSFTMSTSGGLSDMPSYEDFSAAMSDAPSFTSDYPPLSNRNSLMSSTQLSPVASPRMTPQSRSELVRTQSRGRASPSPRPGMRSAPYTMDGGRNKRWSTGSYGTTPSRRPTPFVFHSHEAYHPHMRVPSRHSSPTVQQQQLPMHFGGLQPAPNPYMMGGPAAFRNSMLLPSQLPSQMAPLPSQAFHHEHQHQHFEQPPPLLSHGLFRMLQSNADPHSLHGHYTDLSDPPDLYASLHEEQIPPPPEDMNPSDPDLIPHEQELRFEGDLYTPRWVRGHGNKREGWCGICKPGRWLVLKNSAFWYDKSFTHGISAATGSPFQEPQETRRMDGNPDVWEGLCGSCNEWIALVSSKKKGTTWFRHAYKCHTHPKIKDAPKRRRESSHSRALAASTIAKPKVETQPPPLTPQMTPAKPSVVQTPTMGQLSSQHAPHSPHTPHTPHEQMQLHGAPMPSHMGQPMRHHMHTPMQHINVTSAPQQSHAHHNLTSIDGYPNMI